MSQEGIVIEWGNDSRSCYNIGNEILQKLSFDSLSEHVAGAIKTSA
jgi:hypothetical protein